ncbi:BgTH12-04550 [Blumeria graminis f. sp. triticale]|uniref:BgTH12-04550 n=1 Tax=Blumeria graminis f. sp. triticale TaxID=1689686 RepID=A0A9W4GAY1_BLUGR|nr:BgTH12-04550 [Blumeria graminis f. sp. triticale]
MSKECEGCILDGTLKLAGSLAVRLGLSLGLGIQDPQHGTDCESTTTSLW